MGVRGEIGVVAQLPTRLLLGVDRGVHGDFCVACWFFPSSPLFEEVLQLLSIEEIACVSLIASLNSDLSRSGVTD